MLKFECMIRNAYLLINRTWHISILSYPWPADMQHLVKTIINRSWYLSILPYPYPGIMFNLEGKVKTIINPLYMNLAHLNTVLSLACRHGRIGRHCQERFLAAISTS